MVDSPIHVLGVLFALVSATGAGLLAVLSWRALRESPFGTAVALLTAVLSGTIGYHAVLFVLAPDALVLDAVRSALYTVLAVVLWLVVATHRRLERTATGR